MWQSSLADGLSLLEHLNQAVLHRLKEILDGYVDGNVEAPSRPAFGSADAPGPDELDVVPPRAGIDLGLNPVGFDLLKLFRGGTVHPDDNMRSG
jgi:hypothetical protein